MNFTGKTVYTVNANTNRLDEWTCFGEITGIYQGRKERLCLLQKEQFSTILPKRCVFDTASAALEVTKK